MIKSLIINKKFIAIILLFITILGIIQPVIAASGTGKWVAGQYASYIKTTESNGANGIVIRRLINYNSGEKRTVFCAEHGTEITTGVIIDGNYYTPTDEKTKKACKVAYFGWYSKYGDYVVDGGIMAEDMYWVKLDYVFTQQYIWEALGQTSATFLDSNIQNQYNSFKTDIDNKINTMKKRPSFDATTLEINIGETKTFVDTNGVLASYSSIDKTTNGINFKHNEGENTLTISVSTSCTTKSFKITDAMALEWGFIKAESKDYDTTIYFSFPTGKQDQLFAMHYNDPVTLSMKLKINIYGDIELAKKDNKGNYVPDTSFKVSYNSDMSHSIGTYTTGSNGKVKVEKIRPGTVYIQETDVPKHLILDSNIKSVTVEPAKTTSYQATNNWKQGKIKVVKKDSESNKVVQKTGTVFDIYNSDNTKVTSITTNNEGIAISGLLDYGTYYVKESKAPNKYTVKVQVSENIGVVENGKIYEISVLNTRVKGSVTISKEDDKTGKQAQGEASLKDAIYGLYARTPILDPADGSVIYNTNTKIGELITNEEAKATLSNLYLGEYYIKEIKSSKGYTLDTTKYNFDLLYEGQNVEIVTKNVAVKEKVISQAFRIIKVSSDNNGEAELLSGVEFTIKSKKDIEKYGSWEKAPIAKNADGKETSILITDEKGFAVSDRLPYGSYIVRETKVPNDKYKVPDFTVNITKDNDEPQTWRIFNDTSFKSVLAIIKQDVETQKVIKISGAKFKIKNLDTNQYFGYWEWSPLPHYVDSWETDNTGSVMTNEQLLTGNYQLEELKSPSGYLVSSNPIKFQISSGIAYETLPDGSTPVITIRQQDTSVKGKLNIEKRGEVLTDFIDGKFIYEKKGLPNAKYEIFAKENIMDPSGDRTIIYEKDTVVDTITTNLEGKATSKELPLGEYSIREVKAPEGMVINDEVKNVSLVYKDQNTPIIYGTESFVNERQKVDVNVTKKDSTENVGLLGAEFGIFAHSDILNYKGDIVVKKGDLIETKISDTKGNVHFTSDLPLTTFEIKEIKAPIGYASSNQVINVDATYQGQDIPTINLEYVFKNKIIKVEVLKQDITDSSEIEGAHLTVFEKDNPAAIFDTWISGQDGKNKDGTIKPHYIQGMEVGKTYVLRETSSPYGFTLAQDVEFTIENTGEIQKVTMKDELVYGNLEFNKLGEIFKQTIVGQTEFGETQTPIWDKSNLLGAEITIYAGENIKIGNTIYYKKDEKIQTLKSDWENVKSKNLPVGSYYYIESKTPHGYIADTNKHYFQVEDNQEDELQIISSTLVNNRPKFNIDMTKMLEEQKVFINKDAYKDIVFGIYAREDIYDYMGNIAIKNGKMISTTGITQDGKLENIPDLPNGIYYIKELVTNSQYISNGNQYDFEISYHGKDVAEYTIQINKGTIDNKLARGTIQIQKIDTLDSNKKLENIEFNISVNEDMKDIIATAKTNESGIATFDNLELGTYFIQEVKQVDGYLLNNQIYKVEVTKDGDILIIQCENQPTQMIFSKVDETGVKELEGAEIEIIDKETNEVVDKWVSTKEVHIIHYLVENKEYVMKEVTAPDGYSIAEEIVFTARSGKKVIMKNLPILRSVRVEKLDKNTKEHIKSNKFVFGIFEDKECNKLIKESAANEYQGTALFSDLRFGTYFIKEIQAPLGYRLSEQVVKIQINDKGVFADGKTLEEKDNVYSFEYYNSLLPFVQTGNETNYLLLFSLMGLSSVGITTGVIIIRRKNKKNA